MGCDRFSLFASNISSSTIIGLTGAAYSSGIVQSVYEWISGIPLIISAFVFVPLYLNSKITTIPEFWANVSTVGARFFLFGDYCDEYSSGNSGRLVRRCNCFKDIFPSIIIWQTTLVLALFAGIYTAFGGLRQLYTLILYRRLFSFWVVLY